MIGKMKIKTLTGSAKRKLDLVWTHSDSKFLERFLSVTFMLLPGRASSVLT